MKTEFSEDQRVSMWELSGYEARKIISNEGKSMSDFCRFIGRARQPVTSQFRKLRVNAWYRDRVIDYVGEVAYFRRLISLREIEGRPTDHMVKRYEMLITHKTAPVPARNVSRLSE